MKTPFGLHPRTYRLQVVTALASLALALPAQASFHLMQIEQVIGGVNGDTTAQAVQLRMRFAGQSLVTGGTLIAYDAAGSNPVTLLTFDSNMANNAGGTRILITTANFVGYESSPISSDFTMVNPIPASYLAAGRIIFQKPTYQAGLAIWSVSWGGASYTGPNTGTLDNDADGDFAPPFNGPLPSKSTVALLFGGAASAQSTNNAADYALTTGAVTVINNAGASTSVIGGGPTPTATPAPTATPTPAPGPGTFGNISTRLRVGTGDDALIGGFIIFGTQQKRIIVRAIGPSLSSFFSGVLANPILELRDSSGILLASNNDWRSDQETEIVATGIPPSDDLESAIIATLPAGGSAYTAIVRGVNDGTGIGVVEAYDLDQTVDSKLANISTRGLVQTGDDVLIGGLIVIGQNAARVIVRAIGPSLPVPGALADPTLELRNSEGALIGSNDSWRSDQETEIIATTIPPTSDQEAAIVQNLAPGSYTAIVRGVNNTTGIAVVEAYALTIANRVAIP